MKQFTQGKEWINEEIRGRLTALLEKQQKSDMWIIGVPKEKKNSCGTEKTFSNELGEILKIKNNYTDGMGSRVFQDK